MSINIINGMHRRPNYKTGYYEYRHNGNYIVEFVHPTDKERKILHQLFESLNG